MFLEKRHSGTSDGSSVLHLLTEKPIIKVPSFKYKNKSSPRNSPKLSSTGFDTNLLDKYKLPKPPNNRNGGKFAPGSLEQTNSAIAKHLSSFSAQPIVALDDVSIRLDGASSTSTSTSLATTVHLSNVTDRSESPGSIALTPKVSLKKSELSLQLSSKPFSSKRSLDSSLTEISQSEPPKKLKSDSSLEDSLIEPDSCGTSNNLVTPSPSPTTIIESHSPKILHSQSEPDMTLICTEKPTLPKTKIHQLTTFDKSIPCKGTLILGCY